MSRVSIVGTLVALEVLIVGIALYVIGGAGGHGFHGVAFAASQIAPVSAGTSPAVSVDDPDSRVEVGVSNDGLVHVKDLTGGHGTPLFSSEEKIPPLHVSHTGDSVSIERAASPGSVHFFLFGSFQRRIEIDAPSGSRVEIAHCSGADVRGIAGAVNVHSQDGHITLADLRGPVDARSDDGYIEATGIHADTLAMQSSDGHLRLRDVAVGSLTATTNDGPIDAADLTIDGAQPAATLHSDDGSVHVHASFAPGGTYAVSSNDGRIELGLNAASNLTVAASTGDGKIHVDGKPVESGDSDSAQDTFRLGDGSGSLRVSTNDGSIYITTTNGA